MMPERSTPTSAPLGVGVEFTREKTLSAGNIVYRSSANEKDEEEAAAALLQHVIRQIWKELNSTLQREFQRQQCEQRQEQRRLTDRRAQERRTRELRERPPPRLYLEPLARTNEERKWMTVPRLISK
jgi:hypothetical protein